MIAGSPQGRLSGRKKDGKQGRASAGWNLQVGAGHGEDGLKPMPVLFASDLGDVHACPAESGTLHHRPKHVHF